MSSRYTNGSPLSRGEFIAHMERVDRTLEEVVERLERIEDKMHKPRQILTYGLGTISSRVFLLILTIGIAYIAARFGFGIDTFGIGF